MRGDFITANYRDSRDMTEERKTVGPSCREGLLCVEPREELCVSRSGSAQWSFPAERTYDTNNREFNNGLSRPINTDCSPIGLPSSGTSVTLTGCIRCQAGICIKSAMRRLRSNVSPT